MKCNFNHQAAGHFGLVKRLMKLEMGCTFFPWVHHLHCSHSSSSSVHVCRFTNNHVTVTSFLLFSLIQGVRSNPSLTEPYKICLFYWAVEGFGQTIGSNKPIGSVEHIIVFNQTYKFGRTHWYGEKKKKWELLPQNNCKQLLCFNPISPREERSKDNDSPLKGHNVSHHH